MQRFVVRTYDLITMTNCYNEICGDEAQVRRQKRIMLATAGAFVLAGALSFLASAPLLRKQNLRRLETASKDTVYSFGEGGYVVWEDGEQEQHNYSEFIRLQEDKNCFILHTGRLSGCYLPKADFVEGDAAAFAEFIAQKTGLPMKRKA